MSNKYTYPPMILTSHTHQSVNLRLPSHKSSTRRRQSTLSNNTSLLSSSSTSSSASSSSHHSRRSSSSRNSSHSRSSFMSSSSTLVADDGGGHDAVAAVTTTTSTSTSDTSTAATNNYNYGYSYNAALDRHAIPCAYHGSSLSNNDGSGGRHSADMTRLDSEVQLAQNRAINRALLLSHVEAGKKKDKETMRIKGMKWACGVMRV